MVKARSTRPPARHSPCHRSRTHRCCTPTGCVRVQGGARGAKGMHIAVASHASGQRTSSHSASSIHEGRQPSAQPESALTQSSASHLHDGAVAVLRPLASLHPLTCTHGVRHASPAVAVLRPLASLHPLACTRRCSTPHRSSHHRSTLPGSPRRRAPPWRNLRCTRSRPGPRCRPRCCMPRRTSCCPGTSRRTRASTTTRPRPGQPER